MTPSERVLPTLPTLQAQPQPVKLLLTVEEAAYALGMGRTFLYARLLETGELFSVKVGNRRLVPVSALAAYVARVIALQKAS